MNICVLLPYANPHTTGWIDELRRISDHHIVVGVVKSVAGYRNNHFEEADNREEYLYFFKDHKNKRDFNGHLAKADYLITLGMFEPWFFWASFHVPKNLKVFVLSEPFRPSSNRIKLFAKRGYVKILKWIMRSPRFSFLCMGGSLVKEQYTSFGFRNSGYYQFGHFPVLEFTDKEGNDPRSVIKFIFVGKLIPRKGIDILISSIKHLQSTFSNWRLLIVGDGELKDELLPHCAGDERISYVPNINDFDLMKSQFNTSDILFLPSYFDGWGAVVNEALSSSCSLLLSEEVYAGVGLLEDGKNGFNFNPYKIDEVFVHLENYFKHPEILYSHFLKSKEIFMEWNHKNAAVSFNNMLCGRSNSENHKLLSAI